MLNCKRPFYHSFHVGNQCETRLHVYTKRLQNIGTKYVPIVHRIAPSFQHHIFAYNNRRKKPAAQQ
jgi:hypothetical protein